MSEKKPGPSDLDSKVEGLCIVAAKEVGVMEVRRG